MGIRLIFFVLLISSLAHGADLAVTMDDFNVHEETLLPASERNKKILTALKKHQAKAALFVVGKYIATDDDREVLRLWHKDGHFIGNHTFDHKPFNAKMNLTDEKAQILKCEEILKDIPGFEKIFRFPMLAEGDTAKKRDDLKKWLKEQGYRLGPVTIDASDWYIDMRLRQKLAIDPKADLTPYRDYYLNHMWDRAQYYNNLSKKVLDREVKHTLLIHFNLLNALFLDDLLTMFKAKGWKIISAKAAFQDDVYQQVPRTLPSGQSLIWGLAKESGKFEADLRYPGENDTYEKPKMDALGL